ncbi:MAG: 3-alpha,7-alpha,12-alpha-trihydroxy-5-beta-cholest-24-enoyl-CoA hydratase [Blastopirellula sp.]|nr:MAG: 3-alpha,7-alpha,12-alpha-trihydroxy-5-beta-cholest-24-enoyl-CoA hydratase [Blastopirellula sp.]
MSFNPENILNRKFADVEQSYTERDSIIYALGVGLGYDPLDARQLPFVFEQPSLRAVPSMAMVLGSPGFWAREPDTGIIWQKVLHGEQGMVLHQPLPPAATIIGKTRVIRILDKGEGRGALIFTERTLFDKSSDILLATLTSTTFARGNGGCGGDQGPQAVPHALPDRAPDQICDLPTQKSAALLYRLSGDSNPLHADPEIAKAAGFPAPILHGLCTVGVVCHALLRSYCNYDEARLKSLDLRFSSPVFPGETIRTEMWQDGEVISFRARVLERDIVVLNNGRAVISDEVKL